MNIKYVFDVDGTLTPSRGKIDTVFSDWFEHFATHNSVYFVTGSDRDKTIEQLGEPIYNLAQKVYNCSGNDVWQQNVNIRRKEFSFPDDLRRFLEGWLQASKFPLRTGIHIEERPGTVNFSIIGRGCDQDQRKEYVKYDKINRERETIAYQINEGWEHITAAVGGETGIDIYQTGCDKSQIMVDFSYNDVIYFFGDAMFEGGNDLPLANANVHGKNFSVKGWEHTWLLLKQFGNVSNDNAPSSWNEYDQYKKA